MSAHRPTSSGLHGAGLVIVDKDAGMTSHDVVSRCRKLLGTRKVGHAGTLDPMATGVLVLGVERATKLLGLLSLTTKAYAATIRLGQATTTDDAEGEVVSAADASDVTDAQIAAVIATLTGDIMQVPTRVGPFTLDHARTLDLLADDPTVSLDIDEACRVAFAHRPITAAEAESLSHGRWLDPVGIPGTYAAIDPDGHAFALLQEKGRRAGSVMVVRPANL